MPQSFKDFIFSLSRVYTVIAGIFLLLVTVCITIPAYLKPDIHSSMNIWIIFSILLFFLYGAMLIPPPRVLAKGGLFYFSLAVFITGTAYYSIISFAVSSRFSFGLPRGAVILVTGALPLFVALLQLIFARRDQPKPEQYDVVQR